MPGRGGAKAPPLLRRRLPSAWKWGGEIEEEDDAEVEAEMGVEAEEDRRKKMKFICVLIEGREAEGRKANEGTQVVLFRSFFLLFFFFGLFALLFV